MLIHHDPSLFNKPLPSTFVTYICLFVHLLRPNPPISIMTTFAPQSTNRTVFTFVGDPTSVVEAALAAAKVDNKHDQHCHCHVMVYIATS